MKTVSQHMTYFSVTTKEHLPLMACHKEKIWQESVRVQTSLTTRAFCYTTAATQSSHERCGLQAQSCRTSAVLFCIKDQCLSFIKACISFHFPSWPTLGKTLGRPVITKTSATTRSSKAIVRKTLQVTQFIYSRFGSHLNDSTNVWL